MNVDAEQNLDPEPLELPAEPSPFEERDEADAPRPAEPVVVIQYRSRGLPAVVFFPMTLVASLALFAGYHHFFVEPITSRAQALARRATAPPAIVPANLDETLARVPAALPVELPPFAGPLTLESQPLLSTFELPPARDPGPKPAEVVEPLPVPSTSESPPVPRPDPPREETPDPEVQAAAAGPEAPAPLSIASAAIERAKAPKPAEPEVAEPDPAAEPTPTREELMERIRQEGLLREAREEEMKRRKQMARTEVEAQAQQRIEDERVEFRRALQEVLDSGGQDSGEAIDDLCNQFGRSYTEELKNRAYGSLAHYKGKLSREEEVQMLRAIGVPEAGILDYLANRLHRSMKSRNGPRHPGEVRLFAARQLLRIKVDPSATPAPVDPPERRPATVRRTNNARRP